MISARAARSSAFILTLVLSLLTSVTLAQKADPADNYENSDNGIVSSGVIKSLKDCPFGTDAFFKNVNPFISGGSGENGWLEFQETFLVDGSQVKLTVFWKDDDNSFRFAFDDEFPGIMYALGPEIGNDKLIYTYPTPVFADGGQDPDSKNLAVLKDGSAAADVNHLDLCMSLVDSTAPDIVFISPLPGATESGPTIDVVVKITDDSGVNTTTDPVTVSFNGQSFTMQCEQLSQNEFQCSYTLMGIEDVPAGLYTISVTATDEALPLPGNSITVTTDVQLVKSFTGCFGTLEEGDFTGDPEPNTGFTGCDPTIVVNIQAPPENSACNGPNPPDGCYISGTLLKPASPTEHCGIYGFRDPRMAMIEGPSPEYPVGRWVPITKSSLNIFTEVGVHPDQLPGVLAAVQASYPDPDPNDPDPLLPPENLDKALVLDDKTYCANGCCVIAQHLKGDFLNVLYTAWPDENGLAFIKTHNARFLLGDNLAAKCYEYDPDAEGPQLPSSDLQDAASVGYQPLFQTEYDSGFLTVLTQDCRNPARDLTRNNGFDVSNIIVSTAEPRIYVDDAPSDVLSFMYEQSEQDFVRALFLLTVIQPEDGIDVLVLTGNFNRDVASPINQAKARFDNFNLNSLRQSIDALNVAADGIRTKTTYVVTEANPPGELLALVEHLIWELGLIERELTRVEALP